jgi:hypothetical protein
VIFATAEEDQDEVHCRREVIAEHAGIGIEKLGGLHLLCMPGGDPVLGTADKAGVFAERLCLTPCSGRRRKSAPR